MSSENTMVSKIMPIDIYWHGINEVKLKIISDQYQNYLCRVDCFFYKQESNLLQQFLLNDFFCLCLGSVFKSHFLNHVDVKEFPIVEEFVGRQINRTG